MGTIQRQNGTNGAENHGLYRLRSKNFRLEERGIELSALHNHLLHESPRIMYIHFVGRGDEAEMASAIREALAITATPLTSAPSGPETKPELAIEIERIIGYQGNMGGGVFHITVPRNDVH